METVISLLTISTVYLRHRFTDLVWFQCTPKQNDCVTRYTT